MVRRNNYFRRQPETKAIPIRESEFKIKKLENPEKFLFGNTIKIVTENGTKCILCNTDYSFDEWGILWDCLSEEDTIIVKHKASKIIDAYVPVTKSCHILKDIKYDDGKDGYSFIFADGDFKIFLSWDNIFIRDFFMTNDHEELKNKQEKLKNVFVGRVAKIFWIGKRPVKLEHFF